MIAQLYLPHPVILLAVLSRQIASEIGSMQTGPHTCRQTLTVGVKSAAVHKEHVQILSIAWGWLAIACTA